VRLQPLEIVFPVGGLHRRFSFQDQPPYTTIDCGNVRPQHAGDSPGTTTMVRRDRGGTRPGFGLAYTGQLNGSNPVRLLAAITPVVSQEVQSWIDLFTSGAPSPFWSWPASANASLDAFLFNIWPLDPQNVVVNEDGKTRVGGIRSTLTYDLDKVYTIRLGCVPYETNDIAPKYYGKYYIFAAMNETTPNAYANGIVVEFNLVTGGTQGDYSGTLKVFKASVEVVSYDLATGGGADEPEELSLTVNKRNVTVKFGTNTLLETEVPETLPTGGRIGFALEVEDVGGDADIAGVVLLDYFQIDYISEQALTLANRYIVVASAGGLLLIENEAMTSFLPASGELTLASDRPIQSAERLGKLFIADYSDIKAQGSDGTIIRVDPVDTTRLEVDTIGDWSQAGIDPSGDVILLQPTGTSTVDLDVYTISSPVGAEQLDIVPRIGTDLGGSGTVFYRIERGPKWFDPIDGRLRHWQTEFNNSGQPKGFVPIGCKAICLYRDRIVLAGAAVSPHIWYMSRQGDPFDFDYGETDVAAAVAGQLSDAGRVGDPITALIPHSDDYLVFGCPSSLWVLRGDPSFGGVIDSLSRTIGIISPQAWCHGQSGEVYFMSYDGLYILAPGAGAVPMPVSREKLPHEMVVKDLDREGYKVHLAYDVRDRGVHIYIAPDNPLKQRIYYFYHVPTQSFWPYSFPQQVDPTAVAALNRRFGSESAVMVGCRDGRVRAFRDAFGVDVDASGNASVIPSHVYLGPFRSPYELDGMFAEMQAFLARGSGMIVWHLRGGDTPEQAYNSTPFASGAWTANASLVSRPRMKAKCVYLQLVNDTANISPWAFENLCIKVAAAGRLRL
jgi:hypothetical protein